MLPREAQLQQLWGRTWLGTSFPSSGISSLYLPPCTGLVPSSHAPCNQRQWGVPQASRDFHLSFPTCTSNNHCWILSFLPWPRAPCGCLGEECLEPGLGTDLPTSTPLIAAEAAQALLLAPQERGVCMLRSHCSPSHPSSPLGNTILPEGSIIWPG